MNALTAGIVIAGLLLLVVSVESARCAQDWRGAKMMGLANAFLAGAAAALVGAPFVPGVDPLQCAGAIAAATLIRMVVDRRICPCHLTLWHLVDRLKHWWHPLTPGNSHDPR